MITDPDKGHNVSQNWPRFCHRQRTSFLYDANKSNTKKAIKARHKLLYKLHFCQEHLITDFETARQVAVERFDNICEWFFRVY